jgi:hypothetical protein
LSSGHDGALLRHRSRLAAAALLVALLPAALGCGGPADGDGNESGGGAATTHGSSAAELPTIDPGPDGRLSVVFAGDSVMRELAGALVVALDGSVDAEYIGLASVAAATDVVPSWQLRMAEDPPDLVVVMIGLWEQAGITQLGAWEEPYVERLRPFIDTVTAAAPVLWLGHPPLLDDEEDARVQHLNEVWGTLPDRFDGVHYLDIGPAVAPDGAFHNVLQQDDGSRLLVRQIDGRHFCPDGAALAGQLVLEHLSPALGVQPAAAWEDGAWRSDPAVFEDPQLCPEELVEPTA